MNLFFICQRSNKKEDQIPGLKCTTAVISAESEFETVEDGWDWIKTMLLVPGKWICEVRKSLTGKTLEKRDITISR